MIAQLPGRFQGFRHDDALFCAAISGAREAAVLLLWRHAPHFRNIVRRVLAASLRSIVDPDDILQETSIALLTKSLPSWIATRSDFTRFVSGIVRNYARSQNRRHLNGRHHSRLHEVPIDSLREEEMPTSQKASPADFIQYKETVADLQDRLPLRVREIVMWFVVGYSVAEIASMYDINEETVVMFICTANNLGSHPERQIAKEDAVELFRPARKKAAVRAKTA